MFASIGQAEESENTLPVLGSCLSAFSSFGDPGFGLLLEGVDHVNRFSDRDRIDRAAGSTTTRLTSQCNRAP